MSPNLAAKAIDCHALENILEAINVTKEFRGFVAVNEVSLQVKRGTIHALIGPNGAGKSTFFNLLTKFLQPTSGSIIFQGEDVTAESASALAKRGMVRSFQISATFGHLTLLQNVRVALQQKLGISLHFWKPVSCLSSLDDRAIELLDSVGLAGQANTLATDLSYGRKRALELATTLALEPALLLLDEPTQGMGHEDVAVVTDLIKRVAADRTVLMVEHNMSVISKIADTISVLQRGQILAEGNYEQVSSNPVVIEAYMGAANDVLGGAHG